MVNSWKIFLAAHFKQTFVQAHVQSLNFCHNFSLFNSLKLFSSCPHYRQPNTGFLKVRVIFGYPPWKGLTCKCYLCLHGNRIIIKYFDHIYETIQISFSTSSIRLMRLLDWFQYHINHIHETMKKPLCPLRPVYKKTEVLGLFSWYLSGQASKTSLVG